MNALEKDFARILDGEASFEETKAFLVRSIELMGDPEALAAGARALRERMVRVAAPENAIDVCGTGGDGAHTLNISTAVAFVVAGAGVPVAKHGNRAMSSKSGAADVLEALGVKLTGHVPTLERCLTEANVAFLFAQNHHPAMRHVAAARRELGQRTIFNLLGPLANPAGVERQLMGVFSWEYLLALGNALQRLGSKKFWVVHGTGGLDELAPGPHNRILDWSKKHSAYQQVDLTNVAGPRVKLDALIGGTATENARELRLLLEGRSTNEAYRQAVVLNAGAALIIAGHTFGLANAAHLAQKRIDTGAALDVLNKLIAITKDAP